jgi:hypothetical protein
MQLYSLPKNLKTTTTAYTLLAKLVRRYCLALRVTRLAIVGYNFTSKLGNFWHQLFVPLQEMFNHPRFFFVVADLEYRRPQTMGLRGTAAITQYYEFLINTQNSLLGPQQDKYYTSLGLAVPQLKLNFF